MTGLSRSYAASSSANVDLVDNAACAFGDRKSSLEHRASICAEATWTGVDELQGFLLSARRVRTSTMGYLLLWTAPNLHADDWAS